MWFLTQPLNSMACGKETLRRTVEPALTGGQGPLIMHQVTGSQVHRGSKTDPTPVGLPDYH